MHVLLVEEQIAGEETLADSLSRNGHEVTRVTRGGDAISHEPLDLVLLDRNLPDLDGHEVCRRLRAASPVPIIIISNGADEIDRVLGLHLGADDYLVKPFGIRELLARMDAVGRRCLGSSLGAPANRPPVGVSAVRGDQPDPAMADPRDTTHVGRVGELLVDLRQRRVVLRDTHLHLTRKEFDLLALLMEDPGAVFTRATLLERVWDENWFGSTRTVDAHVSQLRAKLGDARWVETVRGVGFRLVDPHRYGEPVTRARPHVVPASRPGGGTGSRPDGRGPVPPASAPTAPRAIEVRH
jgi:two-component system response regulator RegX3